MKRILSGLCLSAAMFAAVIGQSTGALPLTGDRIAKLPAAQQKPWLDYLNRSVDQMKKDRAALQAELRAAGLDVATVPPSGSSAKSIPLDKPADWYKGDEAKRIADIILSFQTPAGGWSKNLDFTKHVRAKGEHYAPDNLSKRLSPGDFDAPADFQWNYVGTIDNDATTTQIRYLAKVGYKEPALRGLEYLFNAQYPNGGWPQVWPLEGGYHDAITFNDGAVNQTLELLQDVADGRDEFGFVPAATKDKARASLNRGIDNMIAAQITSNGRKTVWSQQHDALTLLPAGGRNYEPASQTSSESAAMVQFLMTLKQPSPAVVSAVYAAIDWFRKTGIRDIAFERVGDGRVRTSSPGAGPIWSRYYEIGSDRPIFGDRDKTIHDDVNEISLERRNGYSWYNAAPKAAIEKFDAWARTHPKP